MIEPLLIVGGVIVAIILIHLDGKRSDQRLAATYQRHFTRDQLEDLADNHDCDPAKRALGR